MFVRVKKSGAYEYLQIVHNQRIDGAVRQQVVATLGRLDVLRTSGQLDALLHSCAKFSDHVAVLDVTRAEDFAPQDAVRLGPPLVFGAVLDNTGRPLCCFLLPGNTADITTLIPVIDQLQDRFGIHDVCVVADRGMISQETIEQLETRQWRYILGARLRQVKEIREEVLSRGGRYQVVHGPRKVSKDLSPLKVKEVSVDQRRYVVCHNEEQAIKDRHDRQAIVAKLEEQLHQGAKSLVGNKGFRKYLRATGNAFAIDTGKVEEEARFDGKWVLRTNTDLSPADVALKYKDLLLVESLFRGMKSLLETRPIYHKCDDTIRGHVFCSFLALLLMKELQLRLEKQGHAVEWRRLLDDLEALEELTVTTGGKTFVVRTATRGDAGKALQAVGVGLGPKIRRA